MTQEESEVFFENEYSEILSAATHPYPGAYFEYPYEGEHLVLTAQRSLVRYVADIDDQGYMPVYLGTAPTASEILASALSFIVSGNYEVGAAVALHYNEDYFATRGELWHLLPENYWFRFGQNYSHLAPQLNDALTRESTVYRAVVSLLTDFERPENQELRETIENDDSFECLYEQLKGK